ACAAGNGPGPTVCAGFDPAHLIRQPRRLRSMHRTFQLGTAAAVLALEGAGLTAADALAPERWGIACALADVSPFTADLREVVAAAIGPDGRFNLSQFAELGLHQLHPFRRLTLLANMAAAHTSLLLGLQGPSFTFTSGAAAGAQTLQEAYWAVASGRAELMLCQAASGPEQALAGAAVTELAAAAVLESDAHARRRDATPLATLLAGPATVAAAARPAPEPAHAGAEAPVRGLLAALDEIETRGARQVIELRPLLVTAMERAV
ncbi:MAG: beta-ketoacyl synthase N-terminal-like domain-containing protein, partial [Terriglobales bacterium]